MCLSWGDSNKLYHLDTSGRYVNVCCDEQQTNKLQLTHVRYICWSWNADHQKSQDFHGKWKISRQKHLTRLVILERGLYFLVFAVNVIKTNQVHNLCELVYAKCVIGDDMDSNSIGTHKPSGKFCCFFKFFFIQIRYGCTKEYCKFPIEISIRVIVFDINAVCVTVYIIDTCVSRPGVSLVLCELLFANYNVIQLLNIAKL